MIMHLITCLVFAAGGALISGILVDIKWKQAAKKLIDKVIALESGLNLKQSEINNLNTKVIALNSRINMMDVTLCQKDKELNELSKNASAATTTVETKIVKKRGPYKKRRYGRPASNNNSAKKDQ